MKFKPIKYCEDVKRLNTRDDALYIETRSDGKRGLYIQTDDGVYLTRAKALKIAFAIIDELSPSSI